MHRWVGGRGLGQVVLAVGLAVGSMVRQLIRLGAGWTMALTIGSRQVTQRGLLRGFNAVSNADDAIWSASDR